MGRLSSSALLPRFFLGAEKCRGTAKPQCTCVVCSGIPLMVSIRVLERAGVECTTRLAEEKKEALIKKKISEGDLARVKRLKRRSDAGEKKKIDGEE